MSPPLIQVKGAASLALSASTSHSFDGSSLLFCVPTSWPVEIHPCGKDGPPSVALLWNAKGIVRVSRINHVCHIGCHFGHWYEVRSSCPVFHYRGQCG